jgi:ligand-binding sensor domain-containing protein/signal transduction histidine kinase
LLAAGRVSGLTNDPGLAEKLVFRSWGAAAGLPQNTVNAIVQTRDGYLWLGTRDGLARFDGVQFKVFGLSDGLQSVEIQTLYVDRHGTLWIGTSGGGLSRWRDGRIESVPISQLSAAGDNVAALEEDPEGRLWVGTTAGLRILENGQPIQNAALAGLERAGIRALRRDRRGGMWVATLSQGLYEFRDNRLAESRGPAGHEKILAYCLLEDQAGDLWGSIGNGIVLCLRQGEWGQYTETNGLPFAYVTCLAQEADGTFWAGSLDGGLYCFESGRFVALRKEQGLSANDIRSLCPDREGNLWVGTRTGGLNRLSRRKLASYGVAQGLTNDYTRSVAETADGTLWVGSTGGGLYRGGPGGFESFAPYFSSVESVLAARDGSLWWGAARGFFCSKEGKVTGSYTNEPWLRSAAVTALCEDGRGGIWAGTSQGILAHSDAGKFVEFPQRIARGAITGLAQQSDGELWVGSMAGGLNRIRLGSDPVLSVTNLLSQAIRTLYLDRGGVLWIGTAGGGLSRWQNGVVTTFTSRQGLGADTIVQIVEDDDGFLWLGCNRGILRVPKSDLNDLAAGKIAFVHPRSFGVNDGMPVEECSSGFSPAGLKTKAGLICISTVKGLVFLDPRRQETDAPPPTVLLEDVLVNGKLRAPEPEPAQDSRDRSAAELTRHLTIPPGGHELELRYTGISFGSPEKVRFRYRLEPLDLDWVEAGERRMADYHHLSPGQYVFSVRACNADGIWSQDGPSLAITLQPYLWETSWFLAAAVLAAVGLLAGAVRLVERRHYKRRLALLETQHAVERERLRISQDMHDDIGSILTQVTQLSDLGQSQPGEAVAAKGHFERIGGHTRAAVQALDEIVWATNPKNDNLPRFAEYVSRFADEYFENSSVRCWQEVPANLPNLPLRSDLRHNVFLATKEAFNNVLKHSRAKEVWLRLAVEEAGLSISVEDDGRGFVPERLPSGGNGLENMKRRLAECGGHIDLRTGPGHGTKIRFSVPLPKAP